VTARLIIGIDPGSRETGIVARCGDGTLAFHRLAVRTSTWDLPDTADLCQVNEAVREVRAQAWYRIGEQQDTILAIEGLTHPNPHVGMANVLGALGTAMVLGAVLDCWPGAIVVPPGQHGAGPLGVYPAALRPTRGQGRGHDRLRHCRSAWDIAFTAEQTLRMQQRGRLA
jgi:hypothetical protein